MKVGQQRRRLAAKPEPGAVLALFRHEKNGEAVVGATLHQGVSDGELYMVYQPLAATCRGLSTAPKL